MLILRRHYHNLLSESIRLDIYRYTNCCHIVITRQYSSKRWLCVCCLGTIALFILILSFIISFNIQKIQDLIIATIAALLLLFLIFYWRSPIIEESILLLDKVSGIETTKRNIFGEKRSSFITTSNIIINEAITMHQVIYYLVAIPPSLTSSLLSVSAITSIVNTMSVSGMRNINNIIINNNNNNNKDTNNSRESKLIPLFCNTCPRIDCLKVIYQNIQLFQSSQSQTKQQHVDPLDANSYYNNSRITSLTLNNKMKRKNGYKREVVNCITSVPK